MKKIEKQTLFVNALIHNAQQEVLVVRRSLQDHFLPGAIELPGGRVHPLESLEQALQRKLSRELSLQTEAPLYYASLANQGSRGPYVRVVFDVVFSEKATIELNETHHAYEWVAATAIPSEKVAPDTYEILKQYLGTNRHYSAEEEKTDIVIHSDGGSRGNPGPSAAGYVIYNQFREILESGGSYIGITNNNQAEYTGVVLALKAARRYASVKDTVLCNIDSSMVVNQLNGIYKIKNRDLWPFNQQIQELMKSFRQVRFHHVPRELNVAADTKVNEILDAHVHPLS